MNCSHPYGRVEERAEIRRKRGSSAVEWVLVTSCKDCGERLRVERDPPKRKADRREPVGQEALIRSSEPNVEAARPPRQAFAPKVIAGGKS